MTWIVVIAALAAQEHQHHAHGAGMDGMRPGSGAGLFASGTSQVPSATPVDMLHFRAADWQFMLHGVLFGVHTNQSGPRGRDKVFAANWIMPMASRKAGPGLLTIRSMLTRAS